MKPRCETFRFTVPIHADRGPAAAAIARLPDLSGWSGREVEQWLRPNEIERFNQFTVDSGRIDFLAGRVAAKSALCALAPETSASDWEIARGLWHQPCPRGPLAGLSVTLAHSAGVAVAIAFDDRWICGVDCEARDRLDVETISGEVSADEAAWARESAGDASSRWLFLWTAREAQGKAKRSGLLFPEALSPTASRSETEHGLQSDLKGNDLLGARCINWNAGVVTVVAPHSSLRDPDFKSALTWIHEKLETTSFMGS
jgi:phosphopantetheinyl transferase